MQVYFASKLNRVLRSITSKPTKEHVTRPSSAARRFRGGKEATEDEKPTSCRPLLTETKFAQLDARAV